jgi:hypothetical protein
MRYYRAIGFLGFLLIILMPGFFVSDVFGDKSDLADECEARCANMDDEGRYRCMKTCINTKRRTEPSRQNDVKGRMAACEDACAGYTGLERIKCIRICLDKKKEPAVIKKDAAKTKNENPCDARCSVLSGVSRDKCLLRCNRESRFEKKN